MLFDEVLGVVEQQLQPLGGGPEKLARGAHLFAFPQPIHQLVAELERETTEGIDPYRFFLPFPQCAFDLGAISAIVGDDSPKPRTAGEWRSFILGIHTGQWEDERMKLSREQLLHSAAGERVAYDGRYFVQGRFRIGDYLTAANDQFRLEFEVSAFYFQNGRKGVGRLLLAHDAARHVPVDDVRRSLSTILHAITYTTRRSRFVVEETSEHIEQQRSRECCKIPRSCDRPRYVLLRPQQIRKLFGQSEENGDEEKSIGAHPRRAHQRTLRAERFAASGLINTVVLVRSTWVGPTEYSNGRRIYRVLVDV